MAKSKTVSEKKTDDSASGLGVAGGAAAGSLLGGIAGANTAGIADIVPMADEAQKTVRAKAKPVVKTLTAVAESAKKSVVQAVTSKKKPAKAVAACNVRTSELSFKHVFYRTYCESVP